MPQVTVWLDEAKTDALTQFALAERRRVADQAALIIERALARRAKQTAPAEPRTPTAASSEA